ncbi:BamA/TamA family outer membrane protein [Sphingomonas sp. BN140010]|uniref:BamA/TamA family outer membrane protein n=1 Tax=Sphingomonas arvum TaxID=2992113 RepID=A0ABT3JD95_9SPHN|nr:BamA/TamA family outer membrane protein [Sphingomonas sp. BN140010]MCW3797011.1 BamA/TamA family outer membrane protein [Sphingomonas sp. BN140010]
MVSATVAEAAVAQVTPPPAERPVCPPEAPNAAPPPPPGANLPVVEPIVCQEEVAREVPPLGADDPALATPLESVAEFEARLRAGEGAAGIAAPTAETELAQPLPSLGQFDVREVELAQSEPSAAGAELRYAVRIEGLDGADAETETALRGQFDALSALADGKGKVANEAMLSARLGEDSKLVQRILQAEGWYDAAVQTRIERSPAADGQPVTAVLLVAPGNRYRIGSITVRADPTTPPDLIGRNLALQAGEPIVAQRIQGAEANVAVVLPQQGYPFATVGQRDVLLDPDTHLGDYTLPVIVGPRARFGGFRTTGDLAFDARHVQVLARFKRGELYDSRDVDDLRQALVATGLLTTVAVAPDRTGQVNVDGTENVTVLVTQNAGPPRTLAASAGYGTGQGFRLEGSWTHRNLFPPEGALVASAVAGTQEQGASVIFRRSNASKRDRTLQFGLEALRSRFEAFDALTGRLFARLSYDSTPIWRKTLTWGLGAELLGTVEEDYSFALGKRDKRRFLIGGVSGQLGFDRTDSLLDPTRGLRAQILVQPEGALSDGFRPYLRSQLDGSAYYPVGNSLVVAGRARIGTTLGIDRFNLAPSRRFYGGGGGSVRGFAYQQLGPKDPADRPLGGLSLTEAAAEVRYRFGDFGVVGFIDMGQVYEDRVPSFRGLRTGVGIGGRYYTSFGPLRFDVATPLGRKPGESRFNIYISIGQAF